MASKEAIADAEKASGRRSGREQLRHRRRSPCLSMRTRVCYTTTNIPGYEGTVCCNPVERTATLWGKPRGQQGRHKANDTQKLPSLPSPPYGSWLWARRGVLVAWAQSRCSGARLAAWSKESKPRPRPLHLILQRTPFQKTTRVQK